MQQWTSYGVGPSMAPVVSRAGLVVIVCELRDNLLNILGSGIVCSASGHIVTCAHILDLTGDLHIVAPPPIDQFAPLTAEAPAKSIPMTVVHVDAANDIALLRPRAVNSITAYIPPGSLGNGMQVAVGTSVGCLGIPYGARGLHTLKLTATVVCGKSTTASGSKRLHLDANMHEGNSGGPVISATTGQIVAIVAERFSPTGSQPAVSIGNFGLGTDSTIAFAIPVEYALPLLRDDGVNV